MKKKSRQSRRKKFIAIGASILAIAIVGGLVGTQFFTANASDRFAGVDTMISQINSSVDREYTILEVVPDEGMGEIGFYVPGEEYNYITELLEQTLGSAYEDRPEKYNEIRKALIEKNICAPDDAADDVKATYPIAGGNNYDEKIFLTDTDEGYHKLMMPQPFLQNVKGSYVATTNPGEGTYTDTGSIEGFVYQQGMGQYNVNFVTNVTETSNPTAYANANLYGAYELDQTTLSYVKVSNVYTTEDKFYIESFEQVPEGSNADYGAITHYKYEEGGDYNFVPDESKNLCSVEVGQVYYKVDFTNNELFRKQVFGLTDAEMPNVPNFKINVETVTMGELSQMENATLSNMGFDMLYIAGDTNFLDSAVTKSYKDAISETNPDITFGRMQTILSLIYESQAASGNRSVIIDYDIFDKVNAGTEMISQSYIYKLAVTCLQQNAEDVFVEKVNVENEDTIEWDTLWDNNMATDGTVSYYHNYAKDNVYCFYDITNLEDAPDKQNLKHGLVSPWLASEPYYDEETVNAGFGDILTLIDSENTVRPGNEQLNKNISQARAIQYIINAWNPRVTDFKTSIHVLELQPCYSFDLTETKVRGWAQELIDEATEAGETVTIDIDQMTTSEFIGKIDDLNTTYDLVYIGVNTGRMNTDKNGRTVYNDANMKGLVYTHVGDLVKAQHDIAGMLEKDYQNNDKSKYLYSEYWYGPTTSYTYNATNKTFTLKLNPRDMENKKITRNDLGIYRYSGNDLTTYKRDELLDYVKGHYAVVLDSRLVDSADTTGVNDEYVDNSSYMFQFLNAAHTYSNVVTCDSKQTLNPTGQQAFLTYLNMNKPQLNNFQDLSSDTTKTLSYAFTITSNVETDYNTAYGLNFYIDINADGQYSTTEELGDCVITSAEGEAQKDADGNYILRSNIRYTLTRRLGSSYVGYIPYKLEVYNSATEYTSIRTSETGYDKMTGAEAEVIKILQIKQRNNSSNNLDMASTGTTFANLIAEAESICNYDIQITSMTSADYETQFNSYANDNRNYINENGYNMIVLGFADVYSDISNTIQYPNKAGKLQLSPLGGVLQFIEEGKSVLFTHDTTSFINVAKADQLDKLIDDDGDVDGGNRNDVAHWGYNINSVLRSVVGMDRFGTTGSAKSTLDDGNILNFTNKSISNVTSINKQTLIDNGVHDFSYVPNSSQAYATAEVQGFTNALLDSKAAAMDQSYRSTYKSLKPGNGVVLATGNGAYSSLHVTQVNQGQITSYPYTIPDDFIVADTHYQYYQLDMEADDDKDGASDIVVWYALGKSGTSTNTPYTASPNDVRNNYYIYSKGNVMYSGVGHSKINGDNYSNEMKLFINTMIAAYKNGVQDPTATIKENASITSGSKTSEYLAFDESVQNNASLAGDLDMYYEVEDANLVSGGKTITVQYYVEGKLDANSKEELIGDSGIMGTKIDLATYPATSDTPIEGTRVYSGNMYRVTIPQAATALGQLPSKRIFIVLTSEFNYYGNDQKMIGTDSLTLVRTQLFDLN